MLVMSNTKGPKPKAKTSRRAPPEGTHAVTLYLPVSMVEGLDAWADKLSAKGIGPAWSRSDVVRAALQRALAERASKGEAP